MTGHGAPAHSVKFEISSTPKTPFQAGLSTGLASILGNGKKVGQLVEGVIYGARKKRTTRPFGPCAAVAIRQYSCGCGALT